MSAQANPLTQLQLAQCEVNSVLAESATLAEAMPRILQAICETLGWEFGEIWRADAAAGVLRCVAYWNGQGAELAELEAVNQKLTAAQGHGGGRSGQPCQGRFPGQHEIRTPMNAIIGMTEVYGPG